MENNFLQTVNSRFRVCLVTEELVLLSNRLSVAAATIDNNTLDDEAKRALVHELRIIRSEYIKSEYSLKWEVFRLLCQMESAVRK